MDLDILFWLAIGAIYLWQALAGRNKPSGQPTADGPVQQPPQPSERSPERRGQDVEGPKRPDRPQPARSENAAPSFQDALREIAEALGGPVQPEVPEPRESRSEQRTSKAASPAASPTASPTASPAKAPAPPPKKRHRTHPPKPLQLDQPGLDSLDEDVFERQTRAPRSSTYDDMFESSLYEPFGDPIDHKEMKIEILESDEPVQPKKQRDTRLSREEARKGIVYSEIFGPPVSVRRRRRLS